MQYSLGNMLKGGGALNPDGLALDLAFALDRSFTTDPAAAGNALITSRRGPAAKFSRGSGATQVNAAGLIEYAPENLSLYSGALVPTVGWNAANVTSTPDGLSHDGKIAYQVSEAATSTDHTFVNTGGTTAANATAVSSGIVYTASIFFKKVAGSIDWVQVTAGSAGFGSGQFANFNIGSGTVGNYAGLASGILPAIESYGNGWYRCSISVVGTATVTNSAGTVFALINNTNGTTRLPSYLGSTANSVLAYGAQLERASTARTYYPTTTAAFYGPRFDHDPATGVCKGLLIEEGGRTNLITQSASRTSVFATNGGISSVTTTTNPFGGLTTTYDNIFSESALTEFHGGAVSQTITLSNATAYTFSTFVKPYGRQYVAIRLTTSFANTVCLFNLIGSGTASTITGTPLQVKIEPFLNGWYRISVSATSTGTGSPYIGVYSSDASGGNTPAGLNDTAWALWGSQFEAGALPTSYIPTTSGTVPRAADVCSIIGSDFSSFWNPSEISVFSETSAIALYSLNSPFFSVQNGTTNVFAVYHRQSMGNRLTASDASSQNTVAAGFNLPNVRYRCAFGVSSGSSALYMGGSLVPSTFVYPYAAADNLKMSGAIISGNVNAHISRISIYRKRLTNEKLQALTTP